MKKADIIQFLQKHHAELQNFGVNDLGIFGSFRRGDNTEQSDIDILVVFQPDKKNFHNFMDLCFFLEDNLGRKIDLLTPESLSPHFGQKILDEVEYVSFP